MKTNLLPAPFASRSHYGPLRTITSPSHLLSHLPPAVWIAALFRRTSFRFSSRLYHAVPLSVILWEEGRAGEQMSSCFYKIHTHTRVCDIYIMNCSSAHLLVGQRGVEGVLDTDGVERQSAAVRQLMCLRLIVLSRSFEQASAPGLARFSVVWQYAVLPPDKMRFAYKMTKTHAAQMNSHAPMKENNTII